MLKETILHLFDTGYCLNFEKMVARNKSMKIQRYYALCGLIEHPHLGPILFDTGYSSHVLELCKRFPYKFYSLITPIRFEDRLSAANQIIKFGYTPKDIKHIIISHFHPDHIGGLNDFPNSQFYCSKKAYNALKMSSLLRSLKEVFFKDLLPKDFDSRLHEIKINPIQTSLKPFLEGFDLFGDQSIIVVDLPGHAQGQIGIFLKTKIRKLFLCADACWQTTNYLHLEYPHYFAKSAIHDYGAFCTTLHNIKDLKIKNPDIEIIPSHCQKIWNNYVKEGKSC